ncbi:hypothetical protein [Pontibacter virosus]|uniref:Uncharacterized protein n=1 Tax=Pontibacter virosus TaxID=1765052 RepID=A0A2U1AZC1_9BACT|nr:hypothetical protein [Pontibacter virosus]PVY41779.1 hypothetical protein C8E01_104150 [Pontibacter virosus]
MKTCSAIAGLVLLSLAANAQETQDLDRPQLRLKPSNKKLDLSYLEKGSSIDKLNPLGKPSSRYSLFPKSSTTSAANAEVNEPRSSMPVLVPDSTIQFSILALKPDSTMAFPMPVIKP